MTFRREAKGRKGAVLNLRQAELDSRDVKMDQGAIEYK